MLKSGGRLVYAACTPAEGENEQLVDIFLAEHPAAPVVSLAPAHGLEITEPGYGKLWPHLMSGEGHFCVTLHKGENRPATSGADKNRVLVDPDRATHAEWNDFAADYLPVLPAHS